jgi:hypothetical protein
VTRGVIGVADLISDIRIVLSAFAELHFRCPIA